ncbi:MAG: hypothetical protein EZS26_000153 [Candidatus Ordinivivax streblomastigis]|uniref:DUF2179 domain-containing protein n=1 Tax=Candidatus Ordinivivax streblomastigis TaxID=2540710 RepID=A0A5M8P5L9_9BACT|nr:MAG: hypothetical protein EZS26_000153 [Candidatus Ordinivivax streblomastigis]
MKVSTEKPFKIQKKIILQEIQDDFFIVVGLFLYALGVTGFLLPVKIPPGGVIGVASVIQWASEVLPIVRIPVFVSYFCINIVLLTISIKIFGFKFSLKTILGVVTLTFLLSFLPTIITKPLVADQPFMGCILGGILCGVGIGLVLTFKGSTGGTDIIALIINKYRHISIGKGLLICDVMVILSSFLVFHSVEKIVFGLVVLGVSSYTVDLVLNGTRQSVQFFIFSEKYEEIATAINEQAHRGCTLLDGTGWYSKKPVKVVVVMAKKTESITLFRIINAIDSNAFISQSSVIGVYGNGFDPLKA